MSGHRFKKKRPVKRTSSIHGNPKNWDASTWNAARDYQDHHNNTIREERKKEE